MDQDQKKKDAFFDQNRRQFLENIGRWSVAIPFIFNPSLSEGRPTYNFTFFRLTSADVRNTQSFGQALAYFATTAELFNTQSFAQALAEFPATMEGYNTQSFAQVLSEFSVTMEGYNSQSFAQVLAVI